MQRFKIIIKEYIKIKTEILIAKVSYLLKLIRLMLVELAESYRYNNKYIQKIVYYILFIFYKDIITISNGTYHPKYKCLTYYAQNPYGLDNLSCIRLIYKKIRSDKQFMDFGISRYPFIKTKKITLIAHWIPSFEPQGVFKSMLVHPSFIINNNTTINEYMIEVEKHFKRMG